jgi:CBS domain-containing membrane protein
MDNAAKTIMSAHLVTIPVDSPLVAARELMEEKRFRHLAVTNHRGEIVGIISQRDLATFKDPEHVLVAFAMKSPVRSVDKNTPLRSAIFKLLEHKISCLLIVDDKDDAIGILTTDDLLWYLAYLLQDSKEKRFSFSSVFDLQTVGEAALQMANAGI